MADTILEQTKKGIALEQRQRERKTEPEAEELSHVARLIREGRLHDAYHIWAYHPTNTTEHRKLPPGFKQANQDLHDLNKVAGMDKSKLKALEYRADEWYYYARKAGVTDISRPVDFEGKRYHYPGGELETERKLIAGIEAKGEEILRGLNQLARSEPQVLDNASKRLKSIRTVLKVPQSYEEIKQGLPPIEKPAVHFIDDLRHGEQNTRSIAKKVLAGAGLDGDAINHESDTFDPRTGRPTLDSTDQMIMEAKEAQDRQKSSSTTSPASTTSPNKGTQSSGEG
jgi:hypothetical protein